MVSRQRVLLVAADAREFDGLRRHSTGVRKLDWPVDWARYAECQGREFWMTANGAGAARAAHAAKFGISECRPDVMVSMGFCGALDPALEIGDVFVATEVETGGRRIPVCQPQSSQPHTAGVLASIDRVAQTAAEKQALRASGASAVEMEAAGVAGRAAQHSIPFFCVRSVTDTASQTFVTDFNQALNSAGHFATIRILKSALRNPRLAFPELIRLSHFCQIATSHLGEFIAGCRF